MGHPGETRVTVWLAGRVQGVGMRWWVRCRALELGLVGTASNLSDGRVEVVAQGTRQACEALVAQLGADAGSTATTAQPWLASRRPGSVRRVTTRWSAPRPGLSGFRER